MQLVRWTSLLLAVCCCFPAAANAQNSTATNGPEEHLYANESGDSLHAFVFRPTQDSARPTAAVVIFHGGGWTIGEASWGFGPARRLASQGLTAIAAQYRLSNQEDITPIDAMADARAVIRWVRRNAPKLGVDPGRIAAYGWSAGAHLAVSAVQFSDSLFVDTVSAAPDALILKSPALDLEIDNWVQSLLGDSIPVQSVSPNRHVREGMPPTLILIGETDTVTPLKGAQHFYEQMIAAGNRCEMEIYPHVGHLFTPDSLPDYEWPQPDSAVSAKSVLRTSEFLRSLGYIK